jgi:hypothetical protein
MKVQGTRSKLFGISRLLILMNTTGIISKIPLDMPQTLSERKFNGSSLRDLPENSQKSMKII